MKKEVLIVLGVLVLLLSLPLIAIASITDLGALADKANKLYTGPGSNTNTYDFGYCTFWAAKRREEIGKPIPNTWGDAHTWDNRSKRDGYLVDRTPTVGAIMETDAGALGHVAFVEKVEPDGSWTVSEMNVKGWNILSSRTFKADLAITYNFIH